MDVARGGQGMAFVPALAALPALAAAGVALGGGAPEAAAEEGAGGAAGGGGGAAAGDEEGAGGGTGAAAQEGGVAAAAAPGGVAAAGGAAAGAAAAPEALAGCGTRPMQSTRVRDLAVRLSAQPTYVFCHLGCCEHLVQVRLGAFLFPGPPPVAAGSNRFPAALAVDALSSRCGTEEGGVEELRRPLLVWCCRCTTCG